VKRLVVCCDGTWNTADQQDVGGLPTPTNVTKIALSIADQDHSGNDQLVFYQAGVGTKRSERFFGGAFGYGLSRNVRDVYRFVVRNFEPGDQLYFLGFSRGAYTARSAAGLIRNSGILRRENSDLIDEAFSLYRDRSSATEPDSVAARLFRRLNSHESRIRFIGVWDTVGAYGIPLSGSRLVHAVNRHWRFHDRVLSSKVDAAFQALAIDEKRRPFKPAIWERSPKQSTEQRVEQMWFSGVHSDVGGGYAQTGLSDIALIWMANNAHQWGLQFRRDTIFANPALVNLYEERDLPITENPLMTPGHKSLKGFYRLLPPRHRRIGEKYASNESAACTAVQRAGGVKGDQEGVAGYRPKNLVRYLDQTERRITDLDLQRAGSTLAVAV
jgi:uncharacterized protein (DUF2235 family)